MYVLVSVCVCVCVRTQEVKGGIEEGGQSGSRQREGKKNNGEVRGRSD